MCVTTVSDAELKIPKSAFGQPPAFPPKAETGFWSHTNQKLTSGGRHLEVQHFSIAYNAIDCAHRHTPPKHNSTLHASHNHPSRYGGK